MSLLTVVQDVCTVVGVAVPTSVIPAIGTNRTMQEMLNCANVMAQRTAYDTGATGPSCRQAATFTGDGITTAWPLPADYKRMLLTTNLRRSDAPRQPMRFISDYDEWLMRRAGVETSSWGEWISRRADPDLSGDGGRRHGDVSVSRAQLQSRSPPAAMATASWPTPTPSGSTSACCSSA